MSRLVHPSWRASLFREIKFKLCEPIAYVSQVKRQPQRVLLY